MSLTICNNCGLKGKCIHLLTGEYNKEHLMKFGFEDKSIASIKIGSNTSAKLYNNGNMTGKFTLLENDTFNNKTLLCLNNRKISSVGVKPFRQTVTKLQEDFTLNLPNTSHYFSFILVLLFIYLICVN